MSYRLDLLPDDGVIALRFDGSVTVGERFQAMRDVVGQHEASGYTRLLADFSQADIAEASNEEVDAYATALAREPAMRRLRIAYVGEKRQTAGVEYIAALRGYFFQRFATRAEALRWLA